MHQKLVRKKIRGKQFFDSIYLKVKNCIGYLFDVSSKKSLFLFRTFYKVQDFS